MRGYNTSDSSHITAADTGIEPLTCLFLSLFFVVVIYGKYCMFRYSVVPERKSFRAYTAVLYLDPKMKIYIQVCLFPICFMFVHPFINSLVHFTHSFIHPFSTFSYQTYSPYCGIFAQTININSVEAYLDISYNTKSYYK